MEQIRPVSLVTFLNVVDNQIEQLKLKLNIQRRKSFSLDQNQIKKELGISDIKKIRMFEIFVVFDEVSFVIPPLFEKSFWGEPSVLQRIDQFLPKLKVEFERWYFEVYLKAIVAYNRFLKNQESNKNLGPFGNVFGGDERRLPEPNTEEESEIIKAVNSYLQSFPTSKMNDSIPVIKSILDKNQYDDVVVKPKANEVYRGMRLTLNDFKNLVRGLNLKIDFGQKQNLSIKPKKPLYYKPIVSRKYSSWTSDKKIAVEFSGNLPGMDADERVTRVFIILVAKVNKQDEDNKFFDLRNWYDEMNMTTFKSEHEIITFGNVLVDKIEAVIR